MNIVLFPGLAADRRLFARVEERLPGQVFIPELPHPEDRAMTLGAYAARYVGALLPATLGNGLTIGGVSFGGQLALEIARVAPPGRVSKVVLIGANQTSASLPRRFSLYRLVSKCIPDSVLPWWLEVMSLPFARFEGLGSEDRELLRAMAREVEVALLRWSVDACARWQWSGADTRGLKLPLVSIHGELDPIVPRPGAPVTHVIPGAGHLLTFRHVERVIETLVGQRATETSF